MEQIDETHYRLVSGRMLHVATGMIAIANSVVRTGVTGADVPTDEWTPEERSDLADFMIDQWTRFKQGSTPGARHDAESNTAGRFVVISDTDDGAAVLARDGAWLSTDVTHHRRHERARLFSSVGEAWTFLNEKPVDWWSAVPGGRPRVVDTW